VTEIWFARLFCYDALYKLVSIILVPLRNRASPAA